MEMIKAFIKKKYMSFLYERIHFSQWHLTPADERPYATYLINRINRMDLTGEVIELGCGLGDILSKLNIKEKEGYDIDVKVIKAARFVHPFLKVHVGSFKEVCDREISLLIAVNFLFSLDDVMFRDCFSWITTHNDIDRIVVDDVPSPPYEYAHDYITYFKSIGYVLESKSRGFEAVGGRRYLLFFKKEGRKI